MSLVSFVSDTLFEPVLSGFLGEQGGQSYAGLKQELMSRMVARMGTPGNHDIERSIRVAEFQAMIVSLKAYEDLVKVLETHEGPVDPEYNPKGFIAGANAYLSKSFRRCVSVSIESDFVVRLRDTVAGDAWLGAEGEAGRVETRVVVTRLVENEFLHASGHKVLPPSFVNLLHAGNGDCPPWVDIYRAFLCEQVKTNPRFSTILNVVMQESLSQKVEGLAEGQNVMGLTLEEVARQQQELIAVIGEALATSKEGPASAAQVADMVSEVVTGQIDEIVKRLDAPFDHKIHTMFRSLEGTAQQEDSISAFHYAQARDPFVGRADRLRQIEADLLDQGLASDDPPKFRWMALCGEGGTGKSRLAREVVNRNRSVWVHAGFVETSILDDLDHVYQIGQRLNGPLLMVVDYAVLARANADLPGFFKEWAAYSQREGAFPVRIIVITRRSKEFLLNELRGKGVDPLRDLSRVEEIKSSPMILEGLETSETISLMQHRMLLTAQQMKSDLVEINDSELLLKLDRFDSRRRPLFAAMVAAEIQRGTLPDQEADPESNRLLLFYEYLDRQKRFYWLPRAKGLGEPETKHAVARHANLVRLATCSGDLGLSHLCRHVPTEVQNGLGLLPELTVADRAGAIRAPLIWTMTGEDLKDEPGAVADDMMPPSKVVPRLEPDLLGERFVLMASDANEDGNTLATVEVIVRLSWSCAPDETAAFLRMAAQDFPRSMHEMHWLPPRPTDKAPEVLKARAKMLRNICSDIATRHGRGMISAEDLTRLFDIVDEFDNNLVAMAEADAEVREHYGQVLRQVANIGARLANASTPFFDPITAVEEKGQARPERTAMAQAFARGGAQGADAEDRLDSDDSVRPLLATLAEIIVARLPAVLDRAGPFLLKPGKYEWRRPFEIAVTDVMGAAHWKHRDNLRKGGRWPTANDENSNAVLNDWWGHVETLSGGDIDDVVVMAGLVSRLVYATDTSEIDRYSIIYPAIRRALATSDRLELTSAARICSMLGNALVIYSEADNLTDAERAHISESITIFFQLAALVAFEDTNSPQQVRRAIGNFITTAYGVLYQGKKIVDSRLEEVVTSVLGLLAQTPVGTPLPINFLSFLAVMPEDLSTEVQTALQKTIETRLIAGAIDVDDFLSPHNDEPVYDLGQLLFGVPEPRLRLPEDTAFALLDILSEKVGSKAIRAALEAIVWTLEESADVRAQVPIGLARRYLDRLRHEHGFDGRDHISLATLTLWGHDIVEGRLGRVQDEITSLWAMTEEPAASRGRALALWGVAVVFDATRAPNDFTATWSEWLRQADLLEMATDQQRLLGIGFSEKEAREHIHSFNLALIDACMAAARLHILDGGDPADWRKEQLS